MALIQANAALAGAAEVMGSLLRADGAANHPWISHDIFNSGRETSRNLADAVHHVAHLHGGQRGIIDWAREKGGAEHEVRWLDEAAQGFAAERLYLFKVVTAVGPLPSTPGQAHCEQALAGQRHAIEMLGRSDRTGCALGAALTLMLDWRAIRCLIDAAAQRFGVDLVPPALPPRGATLDVPAGATPGAERAMAFGAQQMLAQHRGLWDLLASRAAARAGG
ncbi:DUF6975 family protein [Sphingomonas crocodyli]|uniref:Uncharacterized protein n=1 Tax=Sphingomonas crocodyli TaxID=1979270 RepID=A0A437M0D9_9SPHN|nr:hypothetical protein [Sphingomonas crocodyli]RVT91046.1 hypothetical protein EOD43_16080 [Sphingomonas crocodyli]